MEKFKTINGWTKEKMKAIVSDRPFDGPAKTADGRFCSYLSADGNKCAAGLFIPNDNVDAQAHEGPVWDLLHAFPELSDVFPLTKNGMSEFQRAHDNEANYGKTVPTIELDRQAQFGGNSKAAMLAFIDERVVD